MEAIIEALRRFKEDGKQLLVRDHIRPAMSYLNAVGGSVVIDCLEKEEITRIFSDAVDAIMQGDTPTLNFEGSSMVETDDVDYSDDETIGTEVSEELPEVVLGCKVVIRNADKGTKTFKYDLVNGALPKNLKIFTGHKMNDMIEYKEQEWKIEDIIF